MKGLEEYLIQAFQQLQGGHATAAGLILLGVLFGPILALAFWRSALLRKIEHQHSRWLAEHERPAEEREKRARERIALLEKLLAERDALLRERDDAVAELLKAHPPRAGAGDHSNATIR